MIPKAARSVLLGKGLQRDTHYPLQDQSSYSCIPFRQLRCPPQQTTGTQAFYNKQALKQFRQLLQPQISPYSTISSYSEGKAQRSLEKQRQNPPGQGSLLRPSPCTAPPHRGAGAQGRSRRGSSSRPPPRGRPSRAAASSGKRRCGGGKVSGGERESHL